jgi:hypothetical protein
LASRFEHVAGTVDGVFRVRLFLRAVLAFLFTPPVPELAKGGEWAMQRGFPATPMVQLGLDTIGSALPWGFAPAACVGCWRSQSPDFSTRSYGGASIHYGHALLVRQRTDTGPRSG